MIKEFLPRELILLPTLNTNTKIWKSDNGVFYFDPYNAKNSKLVPYDMIVVSKFMVLRDGEWIYHSGEQAVSKHKFGNATTPAIRKLIASSNDYYGLLLIPDEFLRWYCNTTSQPNTVKIEHEKIYEDELDYGDNGPEFTLRYKGLVLTENEGFVNIQY